MSDFSLEEQLMFLLAITKAPLIHADILEMHYRLLGRQTIMYRLIYLTNVLSLISYSTS